ncbi:hypothetical protein [Providencia rettgeri]
MGLLRVPSALIELHHLAVAGKQSVLVQVVYLTVAKNAQYLHQYDE